MWREVPLHYLVLERLRKMGTSVRDQDLYADVVKSSTTQVSFSDFLRALMSLEIRGFISVTLIKEDVRMISLLGDKE
ncbi:hypothetical protein HS1genome_0906 [Sulfodiicoccus acidiphilus]|uniref:DNA-binding protein n=1 Tax=Sulfodiicoccus acidiphilus TaxID=1670455 RepID=A0A348B2W5_9CREN|nr:hypothetical protein [Sulfodiicoccus acidiphilus]BBD72517.1 hypothetical protein HS1genome_0906 [Sulfodiicoccus acidiphilus]GGT93971.1 hypothetical protein GCM10007116_09630 [Sulfodiicoccus acidiphilus]